MINLLSVLGLALAAAALLYMPATASFVLMIGGACVMLLILAALPRLETGRHATFEVTAASKEELGDGRFAVYLVLSAIVVRVFFAVIINQTVLWRQFGPDARGWEELGRFFAEWMRGETAFSPVFLEKPNSQTFYASLNGIALLLTGDARFTMSIINSIWGAVVAIQISSVARVLYGDQAARRALILSLFFPSLLLWNSMNLREVWAHFGIMLCLASGMRMRSNLSPVILGMFGAGLLMVATVRPYLLPLILVAQAASFFVVRPQQLPYAVIGLGLMGLLIFRYGQEMGLQAELMSTDSLERIQELREGLSYGGSAYGKSAETTTIVGAIRYLPEGVVRFLYSPLPWAIESWRQALALPEALLWFGLSIQAALQMIRTMTKRFADVALPLFLLLTFTFAYALVSGNEGTAFRHRAQVIVIALPFIAGWQTRHRRQPEESEQLLGHSSERSSAQRPFGGQPTPSVS